MEGTEGKDREKREKREREKSAGSRYLFPPRAPTLRSPLTPPTPHHPHAHRRARARTDRAMDEPDPVAPPDELQVRLPCAL